MTKFAFMAEVPTSQFTASDLKQGRVSVPMADAYQREIPIGSHILLPDKGSAEALVGVFRKPEQYVMEAVAKPHPADSFGALPEDVRETVRFLCCNDDAEILKHRANMLSWVKQAVDSKVNEESGLRAGMHHDVANVVKDCNIVALEEICKAVGFKDDYLFKGLKEGFKLSGVVPPSGRGEMRHKPAAIPEMEWNSLRHLFFQTVVRRTVTSGNLEDDRCLWEVSCVERDRAWLTGPYEVKQAFEMFGDSLAPARRFLVRQKGKARPIDDFSISGTNAAVETWEKPFLQSLDELVVHIRYFQRCLVLSKGRSGARLLGRTLDLEDAFRHLPTCPSDGGASCVSVFCPDTQKPMIFRQAAMPFGSVTSVHAFARLSEAVRTILVRLFKIICTGYVDDFSLIDKASTSASVSYSVEGLLDALGIRFSKKTAKRVPFRSSFKILGVELRLNEWEADELKVVVRNTPEQKDELKEELDKIQAQDRLTPFEAARLRGRFGFFLTGLWGRSGALFLRALEVKAANLMSGGRVGDDERFALQAAQALLKAEPRKVDVLKDELPLWIFTDASVEADDSGRLVGIGGLIYFPGSTVPAKYFSHKLEQRCL